jgi:hypothetical protein
VPVFNRFLAIVALLMTHLSAVTAANKMAFPQKARADETEGEGVDSCARRADPWVHRGQWLHTLPVVAPRRRMYQGGLRSGVGLGCVRGLGQVFFRLFLSVISDVTAPDRVLDPFASVIMAAMVDALHSVRPTRVPQFAFAWLEIISHRAFMPKARPHANPTLTRTSTRLQTHARVARTQGVLTRLLLLVVVVVVVCVCVCVCVCAQLMQSKAKGWPWFQRLLVHLFKFFAPSLRTVEMSEPTKQLYRGTLRYAHWPQQGEGRRWPVPR